MYANMSEVYKSEFEKRDNGQRVNNPAAVWQKVISEVPALDSRNEGQGYMVYSQQRVMGASHDEAMAYVVKNVVWR